MAQLVRAPPCHGGGHGFESRLGRYGILAQLGEHLPYKQRVTGSSPVGPIYADVAQLAEQLICNQQVIGSSPIIGFCPFIRAFILVGEFPSGQRGQTVNLLAMPSVVRIHSLPFEDFSSFNHKRFPCETLSYDIDAGWSSLEARRAHNPKVTGSNPVPAILHLR